MDMIGHNNKFTQFYKWEMVRDFLPTILCDFTDLGQYYITWRRKIWRRADGIRYLFLNLSDMF